MTNPAAKPPAWRKALAPRAAGVVYAFIALLAVLTITSSVQGRPSYLSSVNLSNILEQSALIGILAIFMTVVLISGNFDLSVASTAALAGTVALKLIDGNGTFLAVLAAIACGALVGLVNALLVQKVGVNAFIVTLGTLTAVRGVVQAILDGKSITAHNTALLSFSTGRWELPVAVALVLGGALIALAVVLAVRSGPARTSAASSGADSSGAVREKLTATWPLWLGGLLILVIAGFRPNLLEQAVPVWIMLGLALVASLVLRFTVIGRNLYAVGGNAEAARLSGINVDRYKMGAFVLNGVLAAVVGVLYAGRFNSVDPTVLTGGELTVIAAAVLGGTSLFGGSGVVVKSVIGTLILFTLSNGFNVLNIGSNYQNVVQGTVLVAAASLYTATSQRDRALFRKRVARKTADPAPVLTKSSA
ncbi:D-xylose transport system permease protein [Asanoa ishikariensis]|uniref:D-xylose transport system permease protein n=1 Tax=Asanoa ishikariensis TaxID=137265 RepID=A0A1H3UC26_9ACTN|nr:ABC transporter permease [Asanoa ishikariensis]SDZ60012.1 D-xylose transport system permease protein [Asanoa ishikariensis]